LLVRRSGSLRVTNRVTCPSNTISRIPLDFLRELFYIETSLCLRVTEFDDSIDIYNLDGKQRTKLFICV